MFKKITATSIAFLGMAVVAFYTAKLEDGTKYSEQEIVEDETNFPAVVVIELFTSQGCSSCPPADVLLEKVKKQYPDEVFALSYHVDYWDYIGWEDPFSKSRYTKRQSYYNQKLGYRGNYTPEAIVNGKEHFVGSSSTKMYAKIDKYKVQNAQNRVTLGNLDRNGNSIAFTYAVEGDISEKTLRAVLVLDERITSIKRGENRNRTLKNSNIVVSESYNELKKAKGRATISIPALVREDENTTLFLLVEDQNLDITGAVQKKV
ncbi:MAG: DUF1223 domain-containing protein [Bacteroidota bacterium]